MFDVRSNKELESIKDMQCIIMLDSSAQNFEGEVCSVKEHDAGTRCGIKLLASEDEMNTFMKEHFIDPSMLEFEVG